MIIYTENDSKNKKKTDEVIIQKSKFQNEMHYKKERNQTDIRNVWQKDIILTLYKCKFSNIGIHF